MRAALLSLGLATLGAAWLGLFDALLPGPFSAHMTAHMAVVAVAAPLCALGVAGGRFDPVPLAPRFFAAVPASIVELVLVWAWHTPALHHAARTQAIAYVAEQGSFLAGGLWLWLSAFGGGARERQDRDGAGILGLLLTSMHMTLLGALLALPPRVLYGAAHGGHHDHSLGSLSALDDQHLGGAIMIALGGALYMLGGLWLAFRLLRRRLGPAPRAEGAAMAARRPEVGR